MNADTYKHSAASTKVPDNPADPVACRKFAEEIITEWKQGETANTRALLSRHAELRQHRSIVLDLLYEEYCLRTEQGESVTISQFCDRFPDYRHSIRQQLEIHQLISDHPELLPQWGVDSWPERGEQLLGYTIVEQLGRGAFARAYLATEQPLGGRHVVIKVARHGEAEAQTLGKLAHRNIVPVHSVQRDDRTGFTVLCMPYLSRATLSDLLDELGFEGGPPKRSFSILCVVADLSSPDLPRTEAPPHKALRRGSYVDGVLYLARELASALAAAHAADILHLDLKPSNVLVTPDASPMLLDFNLSRDRLQGDGRVGGTLAYMSPEQLRAFIDPSQSAQIDGHSDVLSLGVILFQLLCGQPPFGQLPEKLSPQADGCGVIDSARTIRRPSSANA